MTVKINVDTAYISSPSEIYSGGESTMGRLVLVGEDAEGASRLFILILELEHSGAVAEDVGLCAEFFGADGEFFACGGVALDGFVQLFN